MQRDKVRVMFTCLGNICRSPLAEGVFRRELEARGLSEFFEVASSGTGNWHVGDKADRRTRADAQKRGVSLETHRAQQFTFEHLKTFDHVFVMDKHNLHDVLSLDTVEGTYGNKVRLLREADPHPGDFSVPDPYYGGPDGFAEVFYIVERSVKSLVDVLVSMYGLKASTS